MSTNKTTLSDAKKLQTILDLKFISANKLAHLLGYKSPASVYHVVEGRNNLSIDMISKIIKKFPDVNYRYLKDGKEEPILTDQSKIQVQKNMFGTSDSMSKQESLLKKVENPEEQQKPGSLSYNVYHYQLNELIEINKQQSDLLKKLLEKLGEITNV